MSPERILMGVIGRPHGVRGLLHVHSYTADPSDLAGYGVLDDEQGRRFRVKWKTEGVAEVFQIVEGKRVPVTSREAAQALTNTRLFVPRAKLPPADEDEYYLVDLMGLDVIDPTGASLGKVDMVHDYGAGASLEIGRHLVPFTKACVPVVDLEARLVTVVLPHEIVVEPQPGEKEAAE